jgi:hypothetical protein
MTFAPVADISLLKTKVFTLNLAQAAATYTAATVNSTGGILLQDVQFYVATAGATFTSVSVQTNDTTAVTLLSALEGALANLTVGKNVLKAFTGPTYVHTSKLIQFTLVGVTGTGSMLMVLRYQPTVAGADIS